MKETVIATAGNTLAPALAVLRSRGFEVSRLESGSEFFVAQKEGLRLLAEDPLYLLGLATLIESRGTDWPPTDKEVDDLLALERVGAA